MPSTPAHDSFSAKAVFFELCAGSAALSAQAQKSGWFVLPVDCASNRFPPKAKIFEADMNFPHNVDLLIKLIGYMKPKLTHLGLPCGLQPS